MLEGEVKEPPLISQLTDDLAAALRWLLDDLGDAGEDKNPETGEEYDSVTQAKSVLGRYDQAVAFEEQKKAKRE